MKIKTPHISPLVLTFSFVRIISFFIFGSFFTFFSCSIKRELNPVEFIKWVEDSDNGMHVTRQTQDFRFDLQFEPAPYKWLKNQSTDPITEIPNFDSDSLSSMQFYLLKIGTTNHEDLLGGVDETEQQKKLYYFSYLFEKDIHLEEEATQWPCVLFHFEKRADANANRTFVVGFENPNPGSKASNLVIHSSQFGSLPIRIKINKSDIPELKI